jgi:hypothetical protein
MDGMEIAAELRDFDLNFLLLQDLDSALIFIPQ